MVVLVDDTSAPPSAPSAPTNTHKNKQRHCLPPALIKAASRVWAWDQIR